MKDNKVKFIPLGGQAEMGKSMYCLEIDNKIFVLDSGFRFPDSDKLGVDIIIPSFTYLTDNKERISAIIITHGHDDAMAALPYLLKEVNVPVYASNLTADFVEQTVSRYEKNNYVNLDLNLIRIKRNDSIVIDGVEVEFFPVTHSIPGSVGVALWTDYGYIVYAGEFIIDFGAAKPFATNLQKMMEIGNRGVFLLLVESSNCRHEGYTSPRHKLTKKIERIFEESNERIIISTYAQNLFRTQEIIELTKKYRRQIVFYGKDKYDNTNSILRFGSKYNGSVLTIPPNILGDRNLIGDSRYDSNYVVLLSGSPRRIYHDICDIIDGGDTLLKLRKGDTFVVASPVLPGTEKIANKAYNGLYRTDASVHILKSKELFSMHASEEDIKVIIQIFKPKYYIPIKGDYQHFIKNMQLAISMDIEQDNVIIADNGECITFENGEKLDTREKVPVEDIMIDGIGIGDVGDKVIDDRIQLANDGIVVVGVTISRETKDIIAQTDVQTRGFIYLKDSEHIVKQVMEICENAVGLLKDDPYLEVSDVRSMMRDQSVKYIYKETGKKPVFIGVIVEI